MGYYMRYIMADNPLLTLTDLEKVLQQVDSAYAFRPDVVPDLADLYYAGEKYAQIEINYPNEEIFEDDITEFKDLVGAADDPGVRKVLDILNGATQLIAVEIFWEEGKAEASLTKLDPLWDWLFANRKGILQADGEGFYDSEGLFLERNFML